MKKQKRDKEKHPSLKPQFNTRIRQEYTDQEYADDLDDTKKVHKLPSGQMVTAKEWLSIFMNEWNNASVPKQEDAHKGKLHRSKKRIKECTDRNNARNSDVYGIAKARNLAHHIEPYALNKKIDETVYSATNNVEDAIIDMMDKERLDDTE